MSINSLVETIAGFQDYILDKDNRIATNIVEPATGDSNMTRLEVYHSAYSLRLVDVLGKTFSIFQQLIGTEMFEKLGREYLQHYPSSHFSVKMVGKRFSDFLKTRPDLDPLYAELTAFEWVISDVIDAEDAPQLTFAQMAALATDAWPNLALTTHPSVQKMTFSYSVPELWQALRTDEPKPALERQESPMNWLIWRFNLQARFCRISKEQLWMLEAIQSGQNFSDICTGLCDWLSEDKVVNFAAETLRQWISEGIFSAYKIQG